MNSRCRVAIASYLSYLEENFEILPTPEGCRIITPFTRRDGDLIELTLTEYPSGTVRLSDECMTSDYLFLSGLTIEDNEGHLSDARSAAMRFGVDFINSELSITVSTERIGEGLHKLLSATVSVGDLLYKRRHRRISTFDEEVESFFLAHDISTRSGYEVQGKTAIHKVKFYINGRFSWLVEPLSANSTSTAKNKGRLIAFQWLDIQNLAEDRFTYVVVLDDRQDQRQRIWSHERLARPVFDYSTHVFYWSEVRQLPRVLRGQDSS